MLKYEIHKMKSSLLNTIVNLMVTMHLGFLVMILLNLMILKYSLLIFVFQRMLGITQSMKMTFLVHLSVTLLMMMIKEVGLLAMMMVMLVVEMWIEQQGK